MWYDMTTVPRIDLYDLAVRGLRFDKYPGLDAHHSCSSIS